MLKAQDIGVESAQFTLHAERACFIGAATGDHTALVASAVWGDESKLRIVARKCLRGGGTGGQIGGTQAREELLGGCAQRIAEANEFVESRDHAVFDVEVNDGLVLGQAEIAQGIDKEGGAASDFVSEQGNAGA